ncbi:MAG: Gldg family protein [Clostridia bacterium]|nr:Gldg family protein [Clostridia bacterium]
MSENNHIIEEEKKTQLPEETAEEQPISGEESGKENTEKNNDQKPAPNPVRKIGKMTRRQKRRLISIASVCLVLIAVILFNVVAVALTDRFSFFTADITSNSAFNITEESVKIASALKKKVSITFLTDKEDYEAISTYCRQATSIAEQLSMNSNGMLTVEFDDLVKNPTLQSKYENDNITTTDVIIRCGDKYNIVSKEDMFNFELYASTYQYIVSSKAEQAFDSAILRVTSDVTTKVALLIDNAGDDYSYFENVLNLNNYAVTEMKIEESEIPADTETVIAFAPTQDYSEADVNKIITFLNNNGEFGKNFMYIAHENKTDTPNIDKLLDQYGLKLSDGLAFDADLSRVLSTENNYDIIAAIMASELYTDNFGDNAYPVLVSRARGIKSTNDDITIPLLMYSEKSGICPYDADEETWVMSDAITGDVCVMAQGYIGTQDAISSVVVSGSALMWDQTFLQSQYSNQKYLLNMLGTLNRREDPSVQIEEKVLTQYDLNMSVSSKIAVGVFMFAVLPVVILGAGLVVYIIRRRK